MTTAKDITQLNERLSKMALPYVFPGAFITVIELPKPPSASTLRRRKARRERRKAHARRYGA